MKKFNASSTRIWVLLARKARIAAILRRGPSRQVQLIKWNLADDTFEFGQWFKGRVYERRCDLSPAGTLLIYFAATYKEPLRSWTAVSKLPWFTALALWPKGDGWNGGGYFVGPYDIHLDHFPGEDAPHPDFKSQCRKLRIASLAKIRGEDAPVWHFTLKRDGWSQVHAGIWGKYGEKKGFAWKAQKPEEWQKPHQKLPLRLEMLIEALHQENGPWYVTTYRVADESGSEVAGLGLADWADWDNRGNLLFARNGCLYRQSFRKSILSLPVLVADFNSNKFKASKPPNYAKKL
jgi:hypothetical protein